MADADTDTDPDPDVEFEFGREAADGPATGDDEPGSANDAGSFSTAGEPVSLTGVRKEYDDLVAVRDIDLEVEAGELLVLLGPSGCGKTTTLRMVAGLETVSDGTITLGGEDITQTLPQRRDVSMVFQNYALYPHKTVEENLAFPLGKTDLDGAETEQRIREVAELLDIGELLDKYPDQLSGGQQQRVAVGRTIIREPRLFLLDEPLSNLDAKLRVRTRAEIRDLQQRLGTTTLYVTHDQEEALSIADRVVIMNDGDIEQVGTPEAVYTDPVNEFVAGFLGEPTMNFLDVDGRGRLFGGAMSLADAGLPAGARRVGVRPEDVYLIGPDDEPLNPQSDVGAFTAPVELTLDVVEPLGHEYEGAFDAGEAGRLTFRTPELPYAAGDSVEVVFDADRLHAFDADGRAI